VRVLARTNGRDRVRSATTGAPPDRPARRRGHRGRPRRGRVPGRPLPRRCRRL